MWHTPHLWRHTGRTPSPSGQTLVLIRNVEPFYHQMQIVPGFWYALSQVLLIPTLRSWCYHDPCFTKKKGSRWSEGKWFAQGLTNWWVTGIQLWPIISSSQTASAVSSGLPLSLPLSCYQVLLYILGCINPTNVFKTIQQDLINIYRSLTFKTIPHPVTIL
jgi:hypothetical protein